MKYFFICGLLLFSLCFISYRSKTIPKKVVINKNSSIQIKKEINCNSIINIHNLTCNFLKKCGFNMQLLDLDITLLQKKINNCKQKDKSFSKEWDKINNGY